MSVPSTKESGIITRHGFLWRAHFQHPFAFSEIGGAGYYKFVRAWTKTGAKRVANFYRHQGWGFTVEKVRHP